MLNAKIGLIGGTLLAVSLCGSSLNAANMKNDGVGCKTPQDLYATTKSVLLTSACHFIPGGTFVIVERMPLNGPLCVRPQGEIDCLWVPQGNVINR
jgi:hypothetical protein